MVSVSVVLLKVGVASQQTVHVQQLVARQNTGTMARRHRGGGGGGRSFNYSRRNCSNYGWSGGEESEEDFVVLGGGTTFGPQATDSGSAEKRNKCGETTQDTGDKTDPHARVEESERALRKDSKLPDWMEILARVKKMLESRPYGWFARQV